MYNLLTIQTAFSLHWGKDIKYSVGDQYVKWHPNVAIGTDRRIRPGMQTTTANLPGDLSSAVANYVRQNDVASIEDLNERAANVASRLQHAFQLRDAEKIKTVYEAMKQGLDRDMQAVWPEATSSTQRTVNGDMTLHKIIGLHSTGASQSSGKFKITRMQQASDTAADEADKDSDEPTYPYAELDHGMSGWAICDPSANYARGCTASLRLDLRTMQWEVRPDGAWPPVSEEAGEWHQGFFEEVNSRLQQDEELKKAISTLEFSPGMLNLSKAMGKLEKASRRVLERLIAPSRDEAVLYQSTT